MNTDTDLDGVLDWEESLWGTDPSKKDTNGDGIPDNVEITKLKSETEKNSQGESSGTGKQENEKLTETDKFSREFFSTVATLNQAGEMDQATVDKLGSSLAERIQNSPPKKIFLLSEVKVIKDDSIQAIKKYNDTINKIHTKYQIKRSAVDVLQEFTADEGSVDVTVLSELDPIIEQTQNVINELIKMSVPQSFAYLHLDFINGIQRQVENISDIKLYDTDVIIALSAISQYEKNTTLLESTTGKLANAIKQKLNN